MFLHNFKYTFKCLLKNKMLLFWTFIFPILLGTFFKLAFSNIENKEKLDVINIAVVDNSEFVNNKLFASAFRELGNKNSKNQLFNIKYDSLDKSKKLLEDNKIVGYLYFTADDIKIFVNSSGVNETVLRFVVDEISSYQEIVDGTMANRKFRNVADYQKIYSDTFKLINNSSVKFNDISSTNLSYTMIEYYTLLAMSCLYGAIISLTVTNSRLANMTSEGKRISISPINKKAMLLGSFLASYIVQIIGVLLLFIYTVFVLGVDYGSNWGLVLFLIAVGSLAGLSLGIFIAAFFKFSENTKTGVLMSIIMACCFLSGMMGITMKYIIDKNVPILNLINPANMITDGFYALYYYNTLNRYYFNIISLLIFSNLMLLISYYKLRRQRYDSI